MVPVFISPDGVVLSDTEAPTQSRVEDGDCAWDMNHLAKLAEEEARKASTSKK